MNRPFWCQRCMAVKKHTIVVESPGHQVLRCTTCRNWTGYEGPNWSQPGSGMAPVSDNDTAAPAPLPELEAEATTEAEPWWT